MTLELEYRYLEYRYMESPTRLERVVWSLPAPQSRGRILRIGVLELDFDAHGVTARGTSVPLTRAEFAILAALVARPSRVWSRTELLESALGCCLRAYERSIDGHVKNLRRKLKVLFPAASPIRSIYGVGYRLEVSALD